MKNKTTSGFTLVEALVAVGVLSIMVVLLLQMITSATNTILSLRNNLDADDEARIELDMMTRDLEGVSQAGNLDVMLYKPTSISQNDEIYFFSKATTYFDKSNFDSSQKNAMSLIAYRINCQSTTNNGNLYYGLSSYGQMERLGKSLSLDPGSPNSLPFLSYNLYSGSSTSWQPLSLTRIFGAGFKNQQDGNITVGTTGAQFTDGLDSNYRVLSGKTFRFELSYLLKDGSQSNIPIENPNNSGNSNSSASVQDNLVAAGPPLSSNDSSQSYGQGSRWYDTTNQIGYICNSSSVGNAVWSQLGLTDVQAIVATVAVLPGALISNPSNPQTAIIPQAPNADLNALAQKFSKAGSNSYGSNTDIAGKLLQSWHTVVNNAATTPLSGVPPPVAGRIRLYQKYIYLQN